MNISMLKTGIILQVISILNLSTSVAQEGTGKPETWYGQIERFDKPLVAVEYIIESNESGEVQAVLVIGSTTFKLKKFTKGSKQDGSGKFITFRFTPGEEVECLLETSEDSQADLYVGSCPPGASIETAGDARRLTMQRAAVETETEKAVPASVLE